MAIHTGGRPAVASVTLKGTGLPAVVLLAVTRLDQSGHTALRSQTFSYGSRTAIIYNCPAVYLPTPEDNSHSADMSVRLVTNVGELLIELYVREAPRMCRNFLKLCAIKYYHWCIFHRVERDFLAQTGDPTGSGEGGVSLEAALDPAASPYLADEFSKSLRHRARGLLGMANAGPDRNGAQFYITLTERALPFLDDRYSIFGRVVEGGAVLDRLNGAFVDEALRPLEDVYIKKVVVLDDPFPDPPNMLHITRSPPPTKAFLAMRRPSKEEEETMAAAAGNSGRPPSDPAEEEARRNRERARMRAITLELIGDRPSADLQAPDNVLFVCKLNPLTEADDLKMIFSRFGDISSCEVIRDHRTGASLGYAFIEFARKEACEEAYRKMDNVLIDDRRIKVDFSQSLAKARLGHGSVGGGDKVGGRGDQGRPQSSGQPHDRHRHGERYDDRDQGRDRRGDSHRSRERYDDRYQPGRDNDRHRDRDRYDDGCRDRQCQDYSRRRRSDRSRSPARPSHHSRGGGRGRDY